MRKGIIFISLIVLTIILFARSSSSAQESLVPANVQIPLFFKIISFDRNFKSRYKNKIVINVVHQNKFRSSLNVKNDILDFFANNTVYSKFDGLAVEVKEFSFEKENELITYFSSNPDELYYFCPLRAVNIANISNMMRQKRVLSFTGVPEYVQDGISFGFGIKAGKPLIIINLESSKAIGSEYSSQLLKLAKVIE